MSGEQRKVLTWLNNRGVPKRGRRYLIIMWSHISRLTGKIIRLIQSRSRFFTALMIGIIAALVLAKSPIGGHFLAGLGLSIAVLAGCVEELKAAFRR